MLLHFGLGLTLTIMVSAALVALMGAIANRLRYSPLIGAMIGLIVSAVLVGSFIYMPKHVYIVKHKNFYDHLVVFGSAEYITVAGNTIAIDIDKSEQLIINDTEQHIVVEEVFLGEASEEKTILQAASSMKLPSTQQNYFFDDIPSGEELYKESAENFLVCIKGLD